LVTTFCQSQSNQFGEYFMSKITIILTDIAQLKICLSNLDVLYSVKNDFNEIFLRRIISKNTEPENFTNFFLEAVEEYSNLFPPMKEYLLGLFPVYLNVLVESEDFKKQAMEGFLKRKG
jgi:hypothetical protein